MCASMTDVTVAVLVFGHPILARLSRKPGVMLCNIMLRAA
jgi:hypothetical protein